ncbi:MAG: response regulator transcription factor [Holophagaceae bacterium]|nr:response regulator transcription factor [Holophagaceae bacterium]
MRILIIEDEAKLAQVLHKGLKENGYIADWAEDGELGLHMAREGNYAAIILDVMLPKMDGFEVLRELRKAGSTVPIMMLTARSGVDDRVLGLDLGADDYLPKPFDFKELLARLRAVTRRPAVELRNVLKVADLELDLRTREVRRGGEIISLTAKELVLLEYLMSRKGLALTRAMILENVWATEDAYDGGSNLVEVYINFLRKKIDQGHPVKLIQTLRGVGYSMHEPA